MDVNTITMETQLNESRTYIGRQINEIRVSKGLTVEKLSQNVGCDEATIYKIENGRWINFQLLVKIANILNVKIQLI